MNMQTSSTGFIDLNCKPVFDIPFNNFDDPKISLNSVNWPRYVVDTHTRVRIALIDQMFSKSGLKFVSEWTGRGKTTGIIRALGELLDRKPDARILIVTREMQEVDVLWKKIEDTAEDHDIRCVGWCGAHRGAETNLDWLPFRTDVKEHEIAGAQVIVTTHAAGCNKANTYLHQDIDLFIIDEYPDPVQSDVITLEDVAGLREAMKYSSTDVVEAVETAWVWVQGLMQGRRGSDQWIDSLEAIAARTANADAALLALLKFGAMYRQGKGFVRNNGGTQSLVWAEFNLPLEDRGIVFSATNGYEGWQIDLKSRRFEMNAADIIRTDYRDLSVSFQPYHSDIADTRNKAVGNTPKSRDLMLASIREALGYTPEGEDTLLLVPKALADHIKKNSLFPGSVKLLNWGAGIGTNAYMDIEHMIVVGLFHMTSDKLAADSVGHGSKSIEVQNNNQTAVQLARQNHHNRWVIQMINRIKVRQMQGDGAEGNDIIACGANVTWFATLKDEKIVTGIVNSIFLNAVIKPSKPEMSYAELQKIVAVSSLMVADRSNPTDAEVVLMQERDKQLKAIIKRQTGIVARVQAALSFYHAAGRKHVISGDLKQDFGIVVNCNGYSKQVQAAGSVFAQTGWDYSEPIKGINGKPHTWSVMTINP